MLDAPGHEFAVDDHDRHRLDVVGIRLRLGAVEFAVHRKRGIHLRHAGPVEAVACRPVKKRLVLIQRHAVVVHRFENLG